MLNLPGVCLVIQVEMAMLLDTVMTSTGALQPPPCLRYVVLDRPSECLVNQQVMTILSDTVITNDAVSQSHPYRWDT